MLHQLTFLIFFLIFVLGKTQEILFEKEWHQFKIQHNISYKSSLHEFNRRRIFEENLHKILKHNILYERGLKSYKLGITRFADLTPQEFKEMLTFKKKARQARNLFQIPFDNKSNIPLEIDWRQKGAVTAVKDQGYCGSCWAFSVTGSLEGQYFLKHGILESFSEQQLIDCAKDKYESDGCNGGFLHAGFDYIKDNGIESELDYPYKMVDGQCETNKSLSITKIQDYVDIESNNEESLGAAVGLIGPISVAFDAATDVQFYREGIYETDSCSQTELNHGVLIVGYGKNNAGIDYWIVKNSWGRNFGINGYIYMRRGINQCGIAKTPSYPIII